MPKVTCEFLAYKTNREIHRNKHFRVKKTIHSLCDHIMVSWVNVALPS